MSGPVVSTNVTIRMNEDELRRLDELAQRMGVTRSDVIRSLVNNFEEALRREVDREGKRWFALGFVAALESAILDPELVLRFIRRNVDILGFPDFVIGMVKVRNRIMLFSHHDRIGSQLLNLVRSRIEEDVKREEAEIEQEDDGDEDTGGGKAASVHVHIRGPIKPGTPHAAPASTKYKLVITNRAAPAIVRPTAVATVNRSVVSGGGGDAKATANTTVPEKKKSAATSIPATNNSAAPQVEGSNPQASGEGGAIGPSGPVEQTPVGGRGGDFVLALITNLYHKHREALLRAVEGIAGG